MELEGRLTNLPLPVKRLLTSLQGQSHGASLPSRAPRQKVQRQQSVAERLGALRVSQLLDDYQSGMSIKDTAMKYETSKGSVLKILKEHDVTTRPSGVNSVWLKEKHYRRIARKRA